MIQKRAGTRPNNKETIKLRQNGGEWVIFPDMLPTKRWRGYETRYDPTQTRGVFPVGQNVTFQGTDNPTPRGGYEVIGTEASNATPVKRAWVFETREGLKYELKMAGTTLVHWLEGTSTEYETLLTGLTADTEWGYANISETGALYASTYFSNGTDGFYEWNGSRATVSGVTTNTISIASGTWTNLGFYTSGTREVLIDGVAYAYTGGEGTTTLTGVTPDPSANGVAAGDIAVQKPRAVSSMSSVQGSVVFAHDGRIHARLETKKSVWNYSKLDNPDDWTTGATDGDGGAKEVEFGGPITAFAKLNKTILCFKPRIVKLLEFIQMGDRLDAPRYQTLVPSDDKSTSLGAVNQKSTFATPQGVVFVTPDKRMMLLSGITQNDQPQYYVLSEPIQPIFDRGVHDEASGICVDNVVYYAFKQDEFSTTNDIVVVGDLTKISLDPSGEPTPIRWDAPYIGWNVSDWTAIESATDKRIEIRWHSSINSNTYRVIQSKTDNTSSFTTTLRLWNEHFDQPNKRKLVDAIFVEIRMSQISSIPFTVLYDEDGVTNQEEFTLDADSADNKFTKTTYNPFGASPFGSQQIGSNAVNEDMSRYRFFLELKKNIRFFTISCQIGSDGEGENYELIRVGYRLVEIENDIPRNMKITP